MKDHPEISEETAREQLAHVMAEYSRWRFAIIGLGVICVAIMVSAMAMYKGGVIDGDVQNMMIMSTFVFVGAMLLLSFMKVRPLKLDIKDWNSELIKAEVDPSHKIEAPTTNAEERYEAESKHPPTAEYKKMRRIWYANILIAVAIMFISMFLIRLNPDDLTMALVVLFSSYIFIFIAVYYDRQKLKPLREQWKRQQEKARRKEARSKLKGKK